MRIIRREIIPIVFFILITGFIFRSYIISHQIPFPANLLVAYYQPWRSYPDPDLPNGPANKPMGFDNLRIYYPLRNLSTGLIKKFEPPLWNPYAYSGNTLLGTYQSAIFHPLSWLFLIFPQIDAWSFVIMLQPFLSALFMYLFLRSLKLGKSASVFGAIAFSLSGFSIVWWEESNMSGYSAMALPLILLGVRRMISKPAPNAFIIIVCGVVWTVFSGWFQMTFYVLGFTSIYLIYLFFSKEIEKKTLSLILFTMICGLLISAVHLVPGMEAYVNSARGTTDAKFLFDGYLLPLEYLITLIAPDYFGNPATYTYVGKGFYYERMAYFGVVPLVLLLLAFSAIKLRDKLSFWGYAFLIFLSLSLSIPTSWLILYYLKLPLVSVIIPARILFLSVFTGVVMSAYGIEWYQQKPDRKNLLRVSVIMILILGVIWWLILKDRGTVALAGLVTLRSRNLILPTAFIAGTIFFLWFGAISRKLRIFGVYGLVCLTTIGGLYFANKYLYFSDPKNVFPEVPVITELKKISGFDRFWTYGDGKMDSNFASQYRLFSPEGYDSFYIQRYGELVDAAANLGKYNPEINRSDVFIKSVGRLDHIMEDPYRKRLLSLLGVKYVAGLTAQPKDVTTPIIPPIEFTQMWKDAKYAIYQNSDALPRAFIAGDVYHSENKQQILDFIFNPKTDLRKTAAVENYPGIGSGMSGEADIISYTPNKIVITTNSLQGGMLVLTDAFYPGWTARIDGKLTKVYRADYAFRAVELPAGNHRIEFIYNPNSWKAGLAVSAAGLIIVLLILHYFPREKLSHKK